MSDQPAPPAVKLIREWLLTVPEVTSVVERRIAGRLQDTYPAIRLTDIGPIELGFEEVLRRVQVECWAEQYDVAERLSAHVVAAAVDAPGSYPAGDPVGHLAGVAVEAGPFDNHDDQAEKYRCQLDLAAWMYPPPT